jgi:glycosyltransferase involved in cell wall biosynthesis
MLEKLSSHNSIKVAYDASMLGAGYISYRARTGIFRVVEEILLELDRRDDISVFSISLNQEGTIWDDVSSRLYFEKEQSDLLPSFCSTHHSRLHLNLVYRKLINFQRTLVRASGSKDALCYKIGRALEILGSQLARKEALILPQSGEYDVYHCSYFPLPDANVLPDVPRILTIYDMIPLLFPEFFVPRVNQRAIRILKSVNVQKDWIICISEQTKQDFCEYLGMNPARVFVTPLAAADYFYPVKELSHIEDILIKYKIPKRPYLLSLCTLEPRKNLDLLIRAFSDFVQAHPNTDLILVLVGTSGWKNDKIFQTIQDNSQIQDRIIIIGYVPDEDLAPIYSGALGFVYPSLYEGFGLPPLEAMQCGIPVITSNSSSLPEVVGDAGILADPKDQSDLSHAIWQLVSDSELRSQLSQKSLIRAQQFSWSKCVDQTIEVYKTAISNKG